MKKMERRTLDRAEKRKAILNSAIEVFARKGYNNATISEVAELAKVANGTVYLYFKDKVDLLICAMQELITAKLDEIKALVGHEGSAVDRLYKFFILHVELFTSNPTYVRFLVVELRQSEEFYKSNPGYNPMHEYLDYVTDLCAEAIRTGTIRKSNPRTMAYMIVGTMEFMLTQWICGLEEIDLLAAVNEMRAILHEGLQISKEASNESN